MNDQAFHFSTEAWTQTKNLQFYLNPGTIFFHKLFLTVFGGDGEGDGLFNNFCLRWIPR